ncbi:helix-turn-helix domain-containing protein, partial [Rhodococcus sp. IC4_135]|nr:helix-turn-helix domain-containing protein [Rhodococcus sp. IC4_135]
EAHFSISSQGVPKRWAATRFEPHKARHHQPHPALPDQLTTYGDTMIERTRAGLIAAAANGRKGGRPRKVTDSDAIKARQLREKGISAPDIARMLDCSRATVYRYLA